MARVRNYEAAFIIAPDVEEEERKNIIERIKSSITDNDGEINEVDEWGNKKLAYEINDYRDGYYTIINFDGKTDIIEVLEHHFNIITNIIRHLIVKKED
ncbi:MAG: 30S ribosomal protein S6 [Bacillota bacterium]